MSSKLRFCVECQTELGLGDCEACVIRREQDRVQAGEAVIDPKCPEPPEVRERGVPVKSDPNAPEHGCTMVGGPSATFVRSEPDRVWHRVVDTYPRMAQTVCGVLVAFDMSTYTRNGWSGVKNFAASLSPSATIKLCEACRAPGRGDDSKVLPDSCLPIKEGWEETRAREHERLRFAAHMQVSERLQACRTLGEHTSELVNAALDIVRDLRAGKGVSCIERRAMIARLELALRGER